MQQETPDGGSAGSVERDVGSRGPGSGAASVSVSISGFSLTNDGMVAGKGGVKASLWHNERVRFTVCFLGVFVCYFYYGILQETITRGDYSQGEKKEKFRYATTLVFIQCIINAIFARLLIQFFEGSRPDHTRSWLYAVCALSYLGAMVSSNSALQYVNYPTQVLGKSCKPIPVMILGVTILRKKYPMAKYLCVLLIVTGVALFLYKPNKTSTSPDEHVFGFGEMLLLLSLTLDGLTGVAQDHMRGHYQTGANYMMLNVNLWSILMLGLAVLWTGEVWEFLSFADRYPSVIYNILLFGFTSALGQTFIFMTVVYFGPLTCSIVTTTRKFFTILGSVLLFGNIITPLQWLGTLLVFLGRCSRAGMGVLLIFCTTHTLLLCFIYTMLCLIVLICLTCASVEVVDIDTKKKSHSSLIKC
ncbi:solute carrier family 35 member B1 [Silurus meridionalis]|nr:solute carrier family 35 member B1 [Silurus meridionalis]